MAVSVGAEPARAKAMSVSSEARPARAKATPVSRERFVIPVDYGGAWPGFNPTRRATHQRPGTAGVEGAGGTGGHGRASGPGRGAGGRWQGQGGPRDRPLRAAGSRVAISRAGRHPPAHTAAGPHKASQRSARNTSGATSNTTTGTTPTRPNIQKTDIRIGCRPVVELGGFEPPTFSLRTRRATNCAIAPRTHTA